MNIEPTATSASLSGAVAGGVIAALEHVAIPLTLHIAVTCLVFLGSAFLFTIGLTNLRGRSSWSWNDLTDGERKAMRRIPAWFVSLAAAMLVTDFLLRAP